MPFSLNKKSIPNYILGVTALLLLFIYFFSKTIVSIKEDNWKNEVESRVFDIESSIVDRLNLQIEELEGVKGRILDNLGKYSGEEALFDILNSPSLQDYSLQILDDSFDLALWNNILAYDSLDIKRSPFTEGEVYFRNYGLYTFLTLNDSLGSNGYSKISVSLPLEKHYSLDNQYFQKLNFTEELEEEFNTDFEVDFKRTAQRSRDGRDHSFDILNNYGNKIGVVNFKKPAKDFELSKFQLQLQSASSVLFVFILLLLLFKYAYIYKKIKARFLKITLFISVVLALRLIIFMLSIPSQFMENDLLNSAYFSSVFAYGAVRSPLEFFLTAISFLIITIYLLGQINNHYKNRQDLRVHGKFPRILIVTFFSLLVLLVLRGFGAGIKSVIFDSTLRYFRDPSLLPELPAFIMHLNILIMGFCSVLISTIFLIIILKNLSALKFTRPGFRVLSYFILFQFAAFLFDVFQKDPQGTDFTRIVFITLVMLISLWIYSGKIGDLKLLLVLTFTASFLTINLLSYYNSELERESLKRTALELVRPNENYLDYSVFQTLNQFSDADVVQEVFASDNGNAVQTCFEIWSKSVLQKEAISSRIRMFDENYIEVGEFSFRFPENVDYEIFDNPPAGEEIGMTRHLLSDGENNLICGLKPIIIDNKLAGYIEASVIYNLNRLSFDEAPAFLASSLSSLNSTVDLAKLKIFDFHDGLLVNSISDFILSEEEQRHILEDGFSDKREKWLRIDINNESNIIYVLKNDLNGVNRILAVVLKERDLTWNLFDFFKVFFIHTIFVVLFVLVYFFWFYYKNRSYKITYQTQLLTAFLVISIIPSIMLAAYFKDLTEEKNDSAIFYKLSKRANRIEEYLNNYSESGKEIRDDLLLKIKNDLGISFTLYKDKNYIFSTEDDLYEIGILEKFTDPRAYKLLKFGGMKECMFDTKVEKYNYNSYYSIITVKDSQYIAEVNNLFNNILLPLSDIEMDVILFGTYSLAAILVALFSTLLANQISRPIRRLTQATKSVASGDLSIEIESYWKGEVKELTDGFNRMVKDLKKSQTQIAEMERESAWKEMAKQVAHEIKNPLTPMKLSIQQLMIAYRDKSPKFNDIFEKVTNTIVSQIDILKNIASEFSNFARMPNLKIVELNPVKIIEEVRDLFSEEKVEIEISGTENEVTVKADEDQLKRTFVNLVRNSMQAGANKILILSEADEKEYKIRLRDNGRGIDPDIVGRIFEKDFTTKQTGMGIGLHMAKRFLISITGDIEVEQTSASGTTILIRIPRK